MRLTRLFKHIPLLTTVVACRTSQPSAVATNMPLTGQARVRDVLSQRLPALNWSRRVITVIEVTYVPGGRSSPHTHPCPVVGYVLEGALRTRVNQNAETIIHAGEAFYEEANAIHQVSANASDRVPARFLAYFLCEGDGPLSIPLPDPGH